jgi:hypothetical protein
MIKKTTTKKTKKMKRRRVMTKRKKRRKRRAMMSDRLVPKSILFCPVATKCYLLSCTSSHYLAATSMLNANAQSRMLSSLRCDRYEYITRDAYFLLDSTFDM